MDYKKTNAPTNTVTRDLMELCEEDRKSVV